MDQILAFDGSVGILEDLQRRISIIRVMRERRWQRAIETAGTVPWLSREPPEVPARLQIPRLHLDSAISHTELLSSLCAWHLAGQSCCRGIPPRGCSPAQGGLFLSRDTL